MVPNFALSLSFEGIALLRRMGNVWARIDHVSFDGDDLDSAMSTLRDKALALDPKGTDVLLILPNEQIRYMALPDHGGDDVAREIAIRSGLDGATPYAVKDLSFDFTLSGGEILVAAVANETLDEAQAFAKAHGFTPISYAAQAPDGQFKGAVFFGKAKSWRRAARRLPHAIEIVPADSAALTPVAPEPIEPEPQMAMPLDVPDTTPEEPQAEPVAQAEADSLDATTGTGADAEGTPEAGTDDSAPRPVEADVVAEPEQAPTLAAIADDVINAADATDAADTDDQAPASTPVTAEPATAKAPEPRAEVAAKATAEPEDATDAEPEPKGTPPKLTAARHDPRDTPEAVPVSFSTVRASRAEPAAIPPAPRALKLGENETGEPARSAQAFPPVLGKPGASAPDGKAPAVDPIQPDAPATGPDTLVSPKDKRNAAKGLLAAKGERLKKGLGKRKGKGAARTEPAAPGQPKATPAPKSNKGDAPAVAKPASPEVPPAGAATVAAATASAALSASGAPKAPSPLSRLAAMREASSGTAAPPAPQPGAAPEGNATLSRLSKARRVQTARGAAAGADAVDLNERERMTVFGMRNEQKVGGKPRFLGLMLTAALLLFLIGVAAWASVFLDDGLAALFRRDAPTAVATLPEPVEEEPAPDAPLGSTERPLSVEDRAESEDDVELAALDPSPDAADSAAPLSAPDSPRVLTPDEAAATYAVTGIWQRTPGAPLQPPADGVDDIYVASIDPSVQQFDAVALPRASLLERDAALEDPGLPPPAGMTFDFDARGLVRATPEGALTPDGLRIYTGRPDVIPPLRQAALAPEPEAALSAPLAPGEVNPLSTFRPEARPDDIVEQRERATLGGISLDELAALRPVQRPKTVQEEAVEAAPEEPATAQAVNASLVPLARPRNMEAIVRRAEAQRPAEPVQQAAAVAQPLAPSGPTATSVARAATESNAINLGRLNLIGVYGTPSNRRALVRLPGSGKYEKVKTGDRLDGGRVQSISEDALVYVKNGRSVTLKMPRG